MTELKDWMTAVEAGVTPLFAGLPARPKDDSVEQRFLRRASHRVARGGADALMQAAFEEGGALGAEAATIKSAQLRPQASPLSPALVQVREFIEGSPSFVTSLGGENWLVSTFSKPWKGTMRSSEMAPHPRREMNSVRTVVPHQVQKFGEKLVGFAFNELLFLNRETLAIDKRVAAGPKPKSEKLNCMVTRTDGTFLITGDSEGVVRRFDGKGAKLFEAKPHHGGQIHHLALTSDGKRCASVAADGIRVWDVATLNEELFHEERAVRCIAFTPQGVMVAGLDRPKDGTRELLIFDGKKVPRRIELAYGPREILVLPPGNRAVVACDEGPILVIDLATGACKSLLGHGAHPGGLAYSNELGVLASTSQDGSLRWWDVDQAEDIAAPIQISKMIAGVDSRLVEHGSETHFTVKGKTVVFELSGDEIALAPDGKTGALLESSQTVQVLHATGKAKAVELPFAVRRMLFLDDATLLLAGREGAVWIDVSKGKVGGKAEYALAGDVCALGHVSAKEARVVSVSGATVIIDLVKKKAAAAPSLALGGAEVKCFDDAGDAMTLGDFNIDGQVVRGWVQRCAVATGKTLAGWPETQQQTDENHPRPVAGTGHVYGPVTGLVALTGQRIALASWDGSVRIISKTGEQLMRYDADTALSALAASPDGTLWAAEISGRLVQLSGGAVARGKA